MYINVLFLCVCVCVCVFLFIYFKLYILCKWSENSIFFLYEYIYFFKTVKFEFMNLLCMCSPLIRILCNNNCTLILNLLNWFVFFKSMKNNQMQGATLGIFINLLIYLFIYL